MGDARRCWSGTPAPPAAWASSGGSRTRTRRAPPHARAGSKGCQAPAPPAPASRRSPPQSRERSPRAPHPRDCPMPPGRRGTGCPLCHVLCSPLDQLVDDTALSFDGDTVRHLDQQLDQAVHDLGLARHAPEGQQGQPDAPGMPAQLPGGFHRCPAPSRSRIPPSRRVATHCNAASS
jgi:hypothetical protein